MLRARFIVALLGALVLFGACSDDDPTLTEPDATTTAAPTEAPAAPDERVVETVESDLGEILVDGEGRTLYLWSQDPPGESTCAGGCMSNWPPLTTSNEVTAGGGADASLLGTIERDDGSTQITYDEQPLYHYAGDQAPGDTNGQGVAGDWWVIAPDGVPIEE